jgi:transposase
VKKMPKQEYTAEFKEQAVKHAQAVGIVVVARELGLVEQTLRNWVTVPVCLTPIGLHETRGVSNREGASR